MQLVGDDGEPLMRDDGQRQQPRIALWPRNLEVVEATNPSEGAASTGTDVYGEDQDMGDDAAAAAGGAAAASGNCGTEEVGAATGALKELLQQRPPSVSDDELQFLLRQSPEECLEARLGITEAAEHEADVGERARLVFLARVAELLAGSIVVD